MGRVSSVGIATLYGLDGPGIQSHWWRDFLYPFRPGPVSHPASYTMGTGSFPGVKLSLRAVDHPPPPTPSIAKFNSLNSQLNPICHLLALLANHILHVSRIRFKGHFKGHFNPLNAELNPICHVLTLLVAHHILHVNRVRVKGHFKGHSNPSNAELNPSCHLLALLGSQHILHVSRIKVKEIVDLYLYSLYGPS